MRNLKKVLALVVAVAMLASMGLVASAASYTDVAANASYADAVNLLSNLGLIKGYEDGTFRPENTVTRAEAATIIVRMLGLDDEVEQGDTIFTDVNADNWASGYVNVAVANGIVNGMGDGTFEPNGEVTYGQIVKMIVCALGYEPVALANGGWNNGGYIVAGSKAGFTKGVAGTQNAAASRATVARLIYNALEVELMDQKSFSTGINGSTYEVLEGKTILSEYLELEKVEGVIANTYLSNTAYEEGDNTVTLVITKNYTNEDEDGDFAVGTSEAYVAEGTDAATLLGYSVVAYVGLNEDEEPAIFAVAEKAGKNVALTLDMEDDIAEDGFFGEDEDGTFVEYYKGKRGTTKIYFEDELVFKSKDLEDYSYDSLVVNGFNNASYTDEFDVEDAEEITLLDNDNDGNFEFYFVTIANAEEMVEFVVEEIENEENFWDLGEYDFDLDDEDKIYTIIKDGKIVDASAIAEDDVVTILDKSIPVITIYVSSVKVEGIIDEVADDLFTINGKDYKFSPLSFTDEKVAAYTPGKEGVFYINASGKIAYVDAVKTVAGANYVYVVDARSVDPEDDDWDAENMVKVVTATGAVERIVIDDEVEVFDAEGAKEYTGAEVADMLKALDDAEGLIKIDTNASGEITEVYFPGAKDFSDVSTYAEDADKENQKKYYNKARSSYGVVDLAADTLIFVYEEDAKKDLEDNITVTTVANYFVDEASYSFIAYFCDEEEPAEVLIVTDSNTATDSEAPVMVVTKVSEVEVEEDPTIKITGIIAGETVSVIVDPVDEMTKDDVAKGDVIVYAETEAYATEVTVLYDGETLVAAEDMVVAASYEELSDEEVTITIGKVTGKESKYFTFDGFVDDDRDVKFFFADDVNVTVVDYTTGKTATIEEGSASDVKPSSKYEKTVFFKTAADDKDVVTDIVVFVTGVID